MTPSHLTKPRFNDTIRRVYPLIVSLLIVFWSVSSTANTPASDVGGWGPIDTTVGIIDLDAIDSSTQSFAANVFVEFRWHDLTLAHDGSEPIRKALKNIRAPRFLLLNRQNTWSSLENVVDISPDGQAVYRMRIWGNFSQIMRLQDFPLDSHQFKIQIIAFGLDGRPIELRQDPTQNSFFAGEISAADWNIDHWSAAAAKLQIESGRPIDGFEFTFTASRLSGYYFIKYIIPLLMIVAMSWVVFWIDPKESGSQLSVAVTAILTLIAYHIALTNKLPEISYLTRMDLFLFGSTVLVFVSLAQVVYTSSRVRLGGHEQALRLDRMCRGIFPVAYLALGILTLLVGFGT